MCEMATTKEMAMSHVQVDIDPWRANVTLCCIEPARGER